MKIKFLLLSLMVCFFILSGCVKQDGVKSSEASISVGKVSNLENADVTVLLSEGNGQQETISGDALKERKFNSGTEIKLGIRVYVDGSLYAESKDGSSKCPYSTKTLNAGKNSVIVLACRVDKEGNIIEGEDQIASNGGKDESTPSSESSSSSQQSSNELLSSSMRCDGTSESDSSVSYQCSTITKDLSSGEEIYKDAGCFERLSSVCGGNYSEIKCVKEANVSAVVFIGCGVELENQSCTWKNGVLSCNSGEKVSAVKAGDVKYL